MYSNAKEGKKWMYHDHDGTHGIIILCMEGGVVCLNGGGFVNAEGRMIANIGGGGINAMFIQG